MAEILDQFGRGVTYVGNTGGLFAESSQDSTYRANRPILDYDIALLVPRWRHRMLVSDARYIATTFPLVAGAVRQKADYVCGAGWKAQFEGEDHEWGAQAEDVLHEADSMCELRGFPYDFNKCMHIGCGLFDIDGDWFVHLTENPELPGFPSFQFIEGHRVGSRYTPSGLVPDGKYKGCRMINGIIYNHSGAEIAYLVSGYDSQEDQYIDAADMIHASDPRWFTEGRSLPTIAYAVLDWYDVKEIRAAEKIAQKVNAALAIVETTASGTRPINNIVGNTQVTSPTGMQTELFENGLIRYIKAGSGNIQAHESNRPSEGSAKFDDTLTAGAFYGMEWRKEMMDLSKLTGAGVRGFQDNINTAIHSRWSQLARVAKKLRLYQIAKLIERGDIPENKEWMKWGHAQPPDFTVDAQRTGQTDRDNVRAGVDSMPAVIRRNGRVFEEVLREQAKYIKAQQEIAEEAGIDPVLLGTLALPGDAQSIAETTTEDPAIDTESE